MRLLTVCKVSELVGKMPEPNTEWVNWTADFLGVRDFTFTSVETMSNGGYWLRKSPLEGVMREGLDLVFIFQKEE